MTDIYFDEEPIDYGEPLTDKDLKRGIELTPPFGYSLMEDEPSQLVLTSGILVLDRFSPVGSRIFDKWFRFVLPGNHVAENPDLDRLPPPSQECAINDAESLLDFVHIRRALKFKKLRKLVEMGGMAMLFEPRVEDDFVTMYNSIWFENEADAVQVIMRFSPLQTLRVHDAVESMLNI